MNGDGRRDAGGDGKSARASTEELREEIESIGSNLGGLIGELDRRRHEALDVRLQIRRHPLRLAVAAVALLGLVGGAVAISVVGRRRRRALAGLRLRRFRRGLARVMEEPPRARRRGRGLAVKLLVKLLAVGSRATMAIVTRGLTRRRLRSRR